MMMAACKRIFVLKKTCSENFIVFWIILFDFCFDVLNIFNLFKMTIFLSYYLTIDYRYRLGSLTSLLEDMS